MNIYHSVLNEPEHNPWLGETLIGLRFSSMTADEATGGRGGGGRRDGHVGRLSGQRHWIHALQESTQWGDEGGNIIYENLAQTRNKC